MYKLAHIIVCIGVFAVGEFCQAQKLMVLADVKEQQTKPPIPYAHIIFMETQYGTGSNDKGRFLLEVDSVLVNENVRISCIGNQSRVLPSHELSNQVIYFKESIGEATRYWGGG